MFGKVRRKPVRLLSVSLAAVTVILGMGYLGRVQAEPVFYTVDPPVVMIDPGHGGIDHGCVGAGGTLEDEVNLAIAMRLAEELERQGIPSRLTRRDQNVYYDPNATGTRKQQDMQNRVQQIEQAGADIVVSIHMNSYGKQVGPQVFFAKDDVWGKALAVSVTEQLHTIAMKKRIPAPGDYYMLNEPEAINILVECGFLSNPEEERLLNEEDYQSKMANCISQGIVNYWLAKTHESEPPLQ